MPFVFLPPGHRAGQPCAPGSPASNRVGPDGPHVGVQLGIAPLDGDGVRLASYDLDSDNSGGASGPDRRLVATTTLYFGQMRLLPAIGSERLPLAMPMMMTPAGTLKPARVFVIGAGVAGLQAIATARRLGARVEAFDTRPVVEEQVQSLGARFVKVDLGDTGQTMDGYAKALTDEQLEKQRR